MHSQRCAALVCYTYTFSTSLQHLLSKVQKINAKWLQFPLHLFPTKENTQASAQFPTRSPLETFKANYQLVMKALPVGTESQHSGNKIFGVKREGIKERIKGWPSSSFHQLCPPPRCPETQRASWQAYNQHRGINEGQKGRQTITAYSQPLLPELEGGLFPGHILAARESKSGRLLCHSFSITSLCQTTHELLLHTAHLLVAALDRLQLHINPAAHLPAWDSLQNCTDRIEESTSRFLCKTLFLCFKNGMKAQKEL